MHPAVVRAVESLPLVQNRCLSPDHILFRDRVPRIASRRFPRFLFPTGSTYCLPFIRVCRRSTERRHIWQVPKQCDCHDKCLSSKHFPGPRSYSRCCTPAKGGCDTVIMSHTMHPQKKDQAHKQRPLRATHILDARARPGVTVPPLPHLAKGRSLLTHVPS